ncbi:MAG: DUF1592 domain-containing protein [Proteobacteria bacterium]|nr:DUF1592 domain-containing protein [Pseudomonadota bacterium]
MFKQALGCARPRPVICMRHFPLAALGLLAWLGAAVGLGAADLRTFTQAHCIECHGGDATKGGLDLTKLQLEPGTPENFARWEKVFDRVAKGEMPPKKNAQPAAAAREAFVKSLGGELHAVSAAHQRAAGRVVVRRMNRTEYEHTLHDLFGITVPLADLLPEDNAAAGFDNVSSALETSATHLVRYQEAADRALAAALPAWPLTNSVRRWTGRQFLDSRPKTNREGTAPFVRFEGETIILCARLYKHGSVTTSPTPAPGRYRIRASVRAVNTEGKAIPMLVGKISSDRFAHEKLQHVLDHFDVPADKTRVIEVEAALPAGEQVYLEGMNLTFFQDLKKQRNGEPVGDDFKGPGLAVDWIELEGPLDAGLGYARLFGDLPQVPSRYLADRLAGKTVRDDWKKWSVPGEFTKYPLSPVSTNAAADAERLLRAFLPRAFRRPASAETAAHFIQFTQAQLAAGETFGDALRAGYKAALCSPHFLLYVEKPGRLDDFAVAARLARLFWKSLPDDELTALAAKGELTKPAVLRAQTERLLRDPRARRFATGFTGQWLDLRKFHDMKPGAGPREPACEVPARRHHHPRQPPQAHHQCHLHFAREARRVDARTHHWSPAASAARRRGRHRAGHPRRHDPPRAIGQAQERGRLRVLPCPHRPAGFCAGELRCGRWLARPLPREAASGQGRRLRRTGQLPRQEGLARPPRRSGRGNGRWPALCEPRRLQASAPARP